MTITITAPACVFDGIGKAAIEIAARFIEAGDDLKFRRTSMLEQFGKRKIEIPHVIKSRFAKASPGSEIVFSKLEHAPLPSTDRSWCYVFPKDPLITKPIEIEVESLNKFIGAFVPTEAQRAFLLESGVSIPIHVVHIGVAREIYRPNRDKDNSDVVFGIMVGSGKHNMEHFKNAMSAWHGAFPGVNGVRLRVKSHHGFKIPKLSDGRVDVTSDYVSPFRLAEWYRGLDAFVSASFSSGWNFQLQEAMACGVAPITHHCGSQSHLSSASSFLCGTHYTGGSRKVKHKELTDGMRYVYYDRVESCKRGIEASRSESRITWDDTYNKIRQIISQ